MSLRLVFLLILALANLSLLLPDLRPVGTVALTLICPGWGWTAYFSLKEGMIGKVILALGFSYALTTLATLVLHILPGPILTWQLLNLLNLIALAPYLHSLTKPQPASSRAAPPLTLILILIIAALLRFINLGYSEFQGDEALAMTFAADAIEGHDEVLFLRGKGPGEILLPLALWRTNGLITELLVRLPFAIAGLAALATFYLTSKALFNARVAAYGTALLAASGFMLGFSRIVQYQSLVVWMSLLAFWMLWYWRDKGQVRWVFASGLFAGVGLLAHYDALLILPVLGWLFLRPHAPIDLTRRLVGGLVWLTACLSSSLPFYLPYYLDPQFSQTGSYLGDRIGGAILKNNLADFLTFNSFYSSFYYVLLLGLLLTGYLAWTLQQARWSRGWGPAAAVGIMVGLSIWPNVLRSWTGVPFALLLASAFLSPGLGLPHRLGLLWFAVPFLGYNFGVARPLTHIYTILPGWSLLAGWVLAQFRFGPRMTEATSIGLLLFFSGYLWPAFGQTDVMFLQHYPDRKPALYLTPYQKPATGFFGFAHRTGWKAIGALLAEGTLHGDYDSNEEEDITSWYTRHTRRACDPGAEFTFIATNLVDEVSLPTDILTTDYRAIGGVALPNGNGLTVHQQLPTSVDLGPLDEAQLAHRFDRLATPAVFARTPRWQTAAEANFGGQIQLIGYDLNTERAYPGGRVPLTLYWQLIQPVSESYKVFVQLDAERKFAQADSYPACNRFPTNRWRPGQIIADAHALHLSPETPPESLPLVIGLYLPEDGRRLDILDVAGNPAGVSLTLTQIDVVDR